MTAAIRVSMYRAGCPLGRGIPRLCAPALDQSPKFAKESAGSPKLSVAIPPDLRYYNIGSFPISHPLEPPAIPWPAALFCENAGGAMGGPEFELF